ncbi:rho GTPase-activating protein 20-like [Phycodurus eques]|uniref:rho GTPase-activating protein 20-like n=1 Tax=Phycodurus eques TaxID=693459 RepID=UPI002ACE0472|nr:rho GTPase-activating protein 20-like [Phycodurus eques]XP_061546612.1 rho GTPase-activating protein 20-like [Phycodurus eques]
MDNMSPQHQLDRLSQGAGQSDNRRRVNSQSLRCQSAPALVIRKALSRSKTLSRESLLVPVFPETCSLVQSFLRMPDRLFLLHGHIQLKTGMQTQDRNLFLFTDILVIAKAKSANQFKQKAQALVCEMWTASCLEEVCEGSTCPERSFVIGWPTCNSVATFSSAEQKEKWLCHLKSRIKEEKEKEEPKTIPLRVYGKGLNTYAVTKTLPVSNSDSTNEVIRLALQQFSIIGNVKDYQLWILSKRDNTPYQLIGHEFPFSIQMSHVRQALTHSATAPEDRDWAIQAEQLQMHKRCQFILKARPEETLQPQVATEFPQKPFKRRRSLITWAFLRGSSHQLASSMGAASQGCLFGRPLSVVCVEEALPKPVMDMLALLYHEGPWTRGIFRRPAGARAVRELRDSLDSGEFLLPLTRDHIFIIAGVFKDFLRNIPGSLLCCELHEEWMDALADEEGEEEQVQEIKRMMCRLPNGNALLLRYLLAVLHVIRGNAHENQMTSFNLAVCIAPSMLWPPGALCSPEAENEGTRKVCDLVKFMIEHCQQILGEEPFSLFGGSPQRLNTQETGLCDKWTYPLTDSSYDSLENELDTSSGGSPSFCGRRLRSKPGSLDSVLTFSDYEQDTDPDVRHTRWQRQRGNRQIQDTPIVDPASSNLDILSLHSMHRQRRRSEPALVYLAKIQPRFSGSTDGLTGEDDDDDDKSERASKLGLHQRYRRSLAAMEKSSSSLSSNPTSPAPTQTKACAPSTSIATSCRLIFGKHEQQESSCKECPAKEHLKWGTLKSCRSLHPNSWLRKDRRLSLTQQESLEKNSASSTHTNTNTIDEY